jgi:hypothetical protein
MGRNHRIVANLTTPSGKGNVKAPNLCPWQGFNRVQIVPTLHPLAPLAWDIPAHPTALRVPAIVHTTHDEIGDLDRRRLLEPKDASPEVFERQGITKAAEHRPESLKPLEGLGLSPEPQPIDCRFRLSHELYPPVN